MIPNNATVLTRTTTLTAVPAVSVRSDQSVRPKAVPEADSVAAKSAAPDVSDSVNLHEQLAKLNGALEKAQSNLSFSIDEGTGKTIIRVVRQSTGELIRQIPSEEVLAIAERLQQGESLVSLGLETQA